MVSVSPRASANETPFTAATSHAAAAEAHRQVLDHAAPAARGGMMSGMSAPAALCLPADGRRRDAGRAHRRRSSGAASGGTRSAQIASAKAQRVRKRQPDGGLIGLGGSPVSGISVVRRSGSSVGFEAKQRARIGMPRARVDRLDRAGLDDAAEIHHQHAVADVLDDVEIVADEQIGQVEALLQLAAAGSAPAPRSTCRAPRPLRRGSPCAAPAPARGRYSPAGAGRRTVRADSAARTGAGSARPAPAGLRARRCACLARRCRACAAHRRCSPPSVMRGLSEE